MLLVIGRGLGGGFNLLALVALFVSVPLTDLALGEDRRNRPAGASGSRLAFRLVTWLAVPVQVATVAWGAWAAARGGQSTPELLWFVVSAGAVTGTLGITVAHELVHSRHRFERRLGGVVLATVWYMHFAIEHVAGHHRRVATPLDPATARLGESLYAFLPRSTLGGWLHAWALERRRLCRLGRSPWHPGNRMIWFTLAPPCIAFLLGAALGAPAAGFFAAQSAIAFTLLEVVNYVEHYGLLRPQLANGRYGPATAVHSWNSSFRFSNWGLLNLQRHSDHHANAQRPYELLRHHDESPQLPLAYGAMVLLALLPPLWRRVMDPRVLEQRTGAAQPARAGGLSSNHPCARLVAGAGGLRTTTA